MRGSVPARDFLPRHCGGRRFLRPNKSGCTCLTLPESGSKPSGKFNIGHDWATVKRPAKKVSHRHGAFFAIARSEAPDTLETSVKNATTAPHSAPRACRRRSNAPRRANLWRLHSRQTSLSREPRKSTIFASRGKRPCRSGRSRRLTDLLRIRGRRSSPWFRFSAKDSRLFTVGWLTAERLSRPSPLCGGASF